MNRKIIIAVLVVLAAGMTALAVFRTFRKSSGGLDFSWSGYRKDKLTEITASSNGSSYTIKKINGEWHLVKPIESELLQDKAMILANSFLNMHPAGILSNLNKEQIQSYGFPQFKIDGVFDNKNYSFCIGDYTAFSNQMYVRDTANPDLVYVVDESVLSPFTKGFSAILNNYFLNRQIDDVAAIDFRNVSNNTVKLTNADGFWRMPASDAPVDWGTRRFLLSVKDFSFDAKTISFNTSDLQSLGINPDSSPYLTIHYKDGSSNELIIGRPVNNVYPIYIKNGNFKAYADAGSVLDIFGFNTADFLRTN